MKLTAKNFGLVAAVIFMTAVFARRISGHTFSAHCINILRHCRN